jgi:positive regulator of sigma E activity
MASQIANKDTFVHPATVSRISGDSVFVSMDQNVHCDSCRAKMACGLSESKTEEIEIMNADSSFKIDENVNIVINKTLGLRAVIWAYVLPFILLISVLLITSLFVAEWLAGLIALSVLVPYYFILRSLNSVFRKEFKISVLKLV